MHSWFIWLSKNTIGTESLKGYLTNYTSNKILPIEKAGDCRLWFELVEQVVVHGTSVSCLAIESGSLVQNQSAHVSDGLASGDVVEIRLEKDLKGFL